MTITESALLATDSGQKRERIDDLAQRIRPVTLADEQLLPVPRALEPLLSSRALRRGSTVIVEGSVALALALVARASASGSWVAVVGLPGLGVAAAAETGIVLDRLALVSAPGATWTMVVAALLDAIDVVLVRPPSRMPAGEARRLATRAQQRRAVLLPLGNAWPVPADLRLAITASRWEGLGKGHGSLASRRVARRHVVLLPAPSPAHSGGLARRWCCLGCWSCAHRGWTGTARTGEVSDLARTSRSTTTAEAREFGIIEGSWPGSCRLV